MQSSCTVIRRGGTSSQCCYDENSAVDS